MPMQVILREDVPNLGRVGDVVKVKPGYGRNYLIPRGLAVLADERQVRRFTHEKRVIAQREQRMAKAAESLKEQLEKASVTVPKQVGEEEKLYGSVTNREIAEALKAQGIEIDRKSIELDEQIKTLGVHQVKVRLARGVLADLKVWVVAAD